MQIRKIAEAIEYDFGQRVYLKTDTEQVERMVIRVSIIPHGIIYTLACGEIETSHYPIEITAEKDILKTILNQNED
jgi:hypothetical protein